MIGISDEDDHDNDQNIADTFGEESQDKPEEDMEFNKVDNNDDEHDDDDDEHNDNDNEKTLDYEVKEDDDIVGEEEDGCDAEEIVVESDNDNSTSTEGITCSKNNNLTGCNVFFLITVINMNTNGMDLKLLVTTWIRWSGQDTCRKIANPALLNISTRMQLKTGLIYLLILILNHFLRQMLTMMKSYLQPLFMKV